MTGGRMGCQETFRLSEKIETLAPVFQVFEPETCNLRPATCNLQPVTCDLLIPSSGL